MQTWEYKIVASHLDPAELLVILDECGQDGWELVTVVAITDYHPLEVIDPEAAIRKDDTDHDTDADDEVIPLEAFRYLFKRPRA